MDYTVVKTGDVGIGGIMAIPTHAVGAPPQWGTYVTVDDVDVTARTGPRTRRQNRRTIDRHPERRPLLHPSRTRKVRSSPS